MGPLLAGALAATGMLRSGAYAQLSAGMAQRSAQCSA